MSVNEDINGTLVYKYDNSTRDRMQPGTGEPLIWKVPLRGGTFKEVRSGESLPENTFPELIFLVPHETICPDLTTWTVTCWGEVNDMIHLYERLTPKVVENYHVDLKKKLSEYDYHAIYERHLQAGNNREWGRVMRELLTMHVLERQLNGVPIPVLRDPPKQGALRISPCLFIQPKPKFGPSRPPKRG
jgi:hypothetical protein